MFWHPQFKVSLGSPFDLPSSQYVPLGHILTLWHDYSTLPKRQFMIALIVIPGLPRSITAGLFHDFYWALYRRERNKSNRLSGHIRNFFCGRG